MSITIGRVNDIGAVYIGRGSPLGNPFRMNTESDRDRVCDDYEIWFKTQVDQQNPRVMKELEELLIMARDGDLILGCFCSPKRCHGETIKRFLEDRLREEGLHQVAHEGNLLNFI